MKLDHTATGVYAIAPDDLKFRAGKCVAITLARLELHGEEGFSHFRRPAPAIQFFLPRAGIQLKKERLILRLFSTDSDDIQVSRHGYPAGCEPNGNRSVLGQNSFQNKPIQR